MTNLVRYNEPLYDNKPGLKARLGSRIELLWNAGQRGKPGINADINSATEAVREIADPDFEILGTNGTSALCTYNAEGGITLTTAGADADQEILLPHLDANQSPWTKWTWGTDRETYWEAAFDTGANITNAVIWAGLKLTNTSVVATDADQVFVRYQDSANSGKFQVIYSIAGTDYSIDTGITAVLSTRYHVSIEIDKNRVAYVRVTDVTNNVSALVKTLALTDAIDLIPYIGVQASGAAAAKAINVHGEYISRLRGA
jgi:hypothetical protein